MDASTIAEAYVEARDLGKTYGSGTGRMTALRSAACIVRPGDRIAIIGASGSGKSTLLQILGGLEEPTSGQICWPSLGPRESLRPAKIAYIFQNQSLLPALTAVENVELPLLLRDVDPDQARQGALAALKSLELIELATKLPESLSGGQAQRVSAARAVAAAPALILADEPTGQLDRVGAERLLALLLGALSANAAFVVATHDPRVAERMNVIWHLDRGRLKT
jgi:ABC-type lipoprotein export system ATPase subunit